MIFSLSLQKYFSSPSYKSVSAYNRKYVKQIDHCAFRSMNKDQFKIIHDECIRHGLFQQKEVYCFPEINVEANWYKSKTQFLVPRVFSSIYVDQEDDQYEKIKYDYKIYEQYLKQNHFIAWTTLFPFQINHIGFTVENIEDVYMDLKKNGFKINGDIQISDDQNLLQFSLKAVPIDYPFDKNPGNNKVFGSFIEFVQRKNNREGFHTKNASVIFQSTKKD